MSVVTSFDRLSALDAAFLDIETERAPMQVGWTMRFAGAPPSIGQRRRHVEQRLTNVPRLRRCIVEPALGLGDPHWVDDQLFAIDRHVNVIQMIDSNVQPQLSAIAEELLSQPLDRSRPLWRLQLVTGLSDGGFAIIGQAHHALVDGLAAIEIATNVRFSIRTEPAAMVHVRDSGIMEFRRRTAFLVSMSTTVTVSGSYWMTCSVGPYGQSGPASSTRSALAPSRGCCAILV